MGQSDLVRDILREEGALDVTTESVQALFAPKSTGTIKKRAAYVRIFNDWFAKEGLPSERFFDEPVLFRYVS